MKYFNILFLSIFVSLILVSCGDDSNPTSNDGISQYRPTSVTFSDSLTNEKQNSKVFHYTGKLLTSIDFLDEQDATIETVTFEYDGDKLIKQTSSRNSTVFTFEYYADGKLESKTETDDEGEYPYKYKFIYDGDNFIRLEEYEYDSDAWNVEPSGMYEYLYNTDQQLISRICKEKDYDTGEWVTYSKDTLLYENNNVTQYSMQNDEDEGYYRSLLFSYNNDNNLLKLSVKSADNPVFDGLVCVYDDDYLERMLFKGSADDATIKIDIVWEKQESNVFEVSKLLMFENTMTTISDYLNLFQLIMNDK